MSTEFDFESHAIPGQPTDDELLKPLGQRLRRARNRRGMSANECALQARVDRAALDAIERGDPNAGVASLVRIMTTLGIVDEMDLPERAVSDAAPTWRPESRPAGPGSHDTGSPPVSCSRFRQGFCQEVLVYLAFRPLFGD